MNKSELGFGTWQAGPSHGFWTDGNVQASKATLREAFSSSFTHFDTAPSYGNGRSEQLLGSFLAQKSNRMDLTIATKFMPKTPALVAKDVHTSLSRLKTDYIDVLYLHWPSSQIDLKPIMIAVQDLQAQQLVRSIGISNTPLSLLRTLEEFPISCIQLPCSLIWTRSVREIREYAKQRGIALVGYSPLGLGLLSGQHSTPPEDSRRTLYVYQGSSYQAFQALLSTLKTLATEKGCNMAQLSLLWAQSQGCEVILTGARNPNQLKELTATRPLFLEEQEKSLLDEKATQLEATIPPQWDNLFGYRW